MAWESWVFNQGLREQTWGICVVDRFSSLSEFGCCKCPLLARVMCLLQQAPSLGRCSQSRMSSEPGPVEPLELLWRLLLWQHEGPLLGLPPWKQRRPRKLGCFERESCFL